MGIRNRQAKYFWPRIFHRKGLGGGWVVGWGGIWMVHSSVPAPYACALCVLAHEGIRTGSGQARNRAQAPVCMGVCMHTRGRPVRAPPKKWSYAAHRTLLSVGFTKKGLPPQSPSFRRQAAGGARGEGVATCGNGMVLTDGLSASELNRCLRSTQPPPAPNGGHGSLEPQSADGFVLRSLNPHSVVLSLQLDRRSSCQRCAMIVNHPLPRCRFSESPSGFHSYHRCTRVHIQ